MERHDLRSNACIFDAGSSDLVFPSLGVGIVAIVKTGSGGRWPSLDVAGAGWGRPVARSQMMIIRSLMPPEDSNVPTYP